VKYRIEFTAAARRDLAALPRNVARRVDDVLQVLRTNPRPPKADRLQGRLHMYHRVRVGDFRIIYLIEDDRLVVCVVKIGHRKEVYR
jgi:mRNA interferase RelE/StbE